MLAGPRDARVLAGRVAVVEPQVASGGAPHQAMTRQGVDFSTALVDQEPHAGSVLHRRAAAQRARLFAGGFRRSRASSPCSAGRASLPPSRSGAHSSPARCTCPDVAGSRWAASMAMVALRRPPGAVGEPVRLVGFEGVTACKAGCVTSGLVGIGGQARPRWRSTVLRSLSRKAICRSSVCVLHGDLANVLGRLEEEEHGLVRAASCLRLGESHGSGRPG